MNAFRRTALAGAAALVALSYSTSSMAQESDTRMAYIGVLGSYIDLDKDRGADDGTGLGVYFGRQIGQTSWSWEGQLFTDVNETDAGTFTDFYRTGLGLDFAYSFLNQRKTFTPFVLLGLGGNYNDVVPDGDDGWDVFGNVGLGIVSKPMGAYGLRVRAEARYVYDTFGGDMGDIRYSAGIEIPLTPIESELPPPPPPPAAESVEITRTIKPLDSDGDGVPDDFDKCPETPTGMPVDGVGCGLSQVITLTGVNFEFNKASLTPDSRKILEEVALKIKHFADVPMELEGHTDSKGSDDYNQKLSQLRADSVRSFLIEQGVPGDKLTAVGMGESHPVADNDTDAGRALNRRVELHIAGQSQSPSVSVDSTGTPVGEAAPMEAPAPMDAPAPVEAPAAVDAPAAADEPAPVE